MGTRAVQEVCGIVCGGFIGGMVIGVAIGAIYQIHKYKKRKNEHEQE